MSKEGDFILTEIEHYVNQIELAINKITKDMYLSYDTKSELRRRLGELSDKLDDDYDYEEVE